MIFLRGRVRALPEFSFGNSILEVVPDYVYLGTTFNYDGRFNKGISKQVTQVRIAMFAMTTKARRLQLPIDIICQLFDQLVTPILLYASEVWDYQNLYQIEMFHKKFLKSLLCLNKCTANYMVNREVGRYNLVSTVNKRVINFWVYLIDGSGKKLSHTVFKVLKALT